MAIGDPWDTTYNPRYSTSLKNERTGMPSWMPDVSDEVPQDDPLSLQDRRKGRFCTEGCGCIDTGCSNLAGHKCTLPPEIAVTILRTPDGRWEARSDIESGVGEVYHLKYSRGAWRGSRCCSHNADGVLDYACDPCKVSTLPNGKPSECHHANNKYKELDSSHQVGDGFAPRDEYKYDKALTGDVWPRRGVDTWLVPKGYNETLPTDGTEMLKSSKKVGLYTACFNGDGVLQEFSGAIQDDPSCKAVHGPDAYWNQYEPDWTNNDVTDRDPVEDLIDTELQQTQFSANVASARMNIKVAEKRIKIDEDNLLVGYSIQNGTDEEVAENVADAEITYSDVGAREGGCIEDGAVPIKKRPWCRNSATGKRIRQECTDTSKRNKEDCEHFGCSIDGGYDNPESCSAAGGTWTGESEAETWLYDDKSECEGFGACYPPEETGVSGIADLSGTPLSPYCAVKGSCTKEAGICDIDTDNNTTEEDCTELACYSNDVKTGKDEGSCTGTGELWTNGNWGSKKVYTKTNCLAIDGAEWVEETPYESDGYCLDEIGHKVPPGAMTEQECRDSDAETWIEPCCENKKDCENVHERDAPSGTVWVHGSKGNCLEHLGNEKAKCKNSDGEDFAAGECSLDPENNTTQPACEALACYKDGVKLDNTEAYCNATGEVWKGGSWTSYSSKRGCEAADGIWYHNVWMPNDWVDWEYERRSCCGGTILDQSHPFHTPQISGGAANTRKNTVCFTPYSEVILSPSANSGFIGDLRGAGCTSIGNQFDRQIFFPDTESYWTIVIRPCNFWGSCMEEGKKRPDPSQLIGQADNYFDTTCGEEVVLYLPVDQFLNCSNFNLTLKSETQLRSGWKEPEPMWDERMGAYEYGNPATNIAAKVGAMDNAVAGAGNISGGFPGIPFSTQYPEWCMNPDANWDGIEDGGQGGLGCDQYVYYASGKEFRRLANAKGAEVLHGFNIQPQPFKPSEEKQNRAKPFQQAVSDKRYWQGCVDHKLGHRNGGGHWFWNYGIDYFMYHDFTAWDELNVGRDGTFSVKPGGHCERIAQAALDYVDSHVGFLRRGDCGYGNGAMWVGWVPYDATVNDPSCRECEPISKGGCGSASSCIKEDGTFYDGDCLEADTDAGAATKFCCEWTEECSEQICTNLSEVIKPPICDINAGANSSREECEKFQCYDTGGKEYHEYYCDRGGHDNEEDCARAGGKWIGQKLIRDFNIASCLSKLYVWRQGNWSGEEECIWREATNKVECECEMSNTCAGGTWSEGCNIHPDRLLNEECSIVEDIPEDLIDIVLGKQVGTVGGQGNTYPARENEVVRVRVDGPLSTGFTDLSQIEGGFKKPACFAYIPELDIFGEEVPLVDTEEDCYTVGDAAGIEVIWGAKPGLLGTGGSEVGNSMTYWHHTGLFPKGEMVSYVNDHCLGTSQQRRIQYASNDSPIRITSRNHLLKDGDLVNISNVAGNFAANVMTTGEWQETQWEEKIYNQCEDDCEQPMWPDSVCPKDSVCMDKNGNEIPGLDRQGCTLGSCKDKRADGSECIDGGSCEASKDKCAPKNSDGTCPEGFVKHPSFDFSAGETCDGEKFACCLDVAGNGTCVNYLWENPESQMGCGSTWDGKVGNTFSTFCDSDKFYACEGERILGKDPPPMQAFVAKNVTLDTFDLFTCDKHPVDGTIQNKTNLDTTECPDESRMVCVKNAGYPYEAVVTEPKWSVVTAETNDDRHVGLPYIEPFEKKEYCVNSEDNIVVDLTTKAMCLEDVELTNYRWVNNYGLTEGECDIDSQNNKTQLDCTAFACYANDLKVETLKQHECTGYNKDGAPLTWTNGNWSGAEGAADRCSTFGICTIIDNHFGIDKSMFTRDECVLLAKTFRRFYPDKGYTDGNQEYVNQCYDIDANRDNHKSIINNAKDFDKVEQQCQKRNGKCLDFNGDDIGASSEDQCTRMGGTWKAGYAKTQYAECVDTEALKDGDDLNAFKGCWIQNDFKSSNELMTGGAIGGGGSKGKPAVGVWKVCPFTGDFIYWGHAANGDVGVEAGYVGHLSQAELDSMYRFGWGGPGYKWEERANDYYVQIEQKGICPVCCDHFMPRSLTATIIDQPTEILNHIGCRMDPCDAPTADDSVKISDVTGKASHDGYCCSDAHHGCDMGWMGGDVAVCESEFIDTSPGKCVLTSTGETVNVSEQDCLGPVYTWKGGITFGHCHRDGELLVAYRQDDCVDNKGGTFTPLPNPQSCDMFIRTRLNVAGTTNCRRCSDVYSSRHKIKTHAETGNVKSREMGLLDYAGNNCCEDTTLCERTVNEHDNRLLNRNFPYPKCQDVRFHIGACGSKDVKVGDVEHVGNVKATCSKLFDPYGQEVGVDWHFEPCACFPHNVPYEYEGEYVYDEGKLGSCDFNGDVNEDGDVGVNNAGGCYTLAHCVDEFGVRNGLGEQACKASATSTWVEKGLGAGRGRKDGTVESDCDANTEEWKSGAGGCGPTRITTDADESCYDLGNSVQPYDSTCPGLGTLDVPLEYDGVVWRSEWTLMNEVGLKQCEATDNGFGVHRFHWPVHCRATGPTVPDVDYISPTEIVAVNADCDGCDMPQMGMWGILIDGEARETGVPHTGKRDKNRLFQHRNVKPPTATNDGHFIRVVMGCGNSIPSIAAYNSGDVVDGGFGPQGSTNYRDNGIQIWSEITNCTFTDFIGSEGLRVGRVDSGISGSPPCFPGLPCISKRQLIKSVHGPDTELSPPGEPTITERVFAFAGRCMTHQYCGPKGPCHGTECCTYKGRDQALFISGPLWNGAIACSQGGDIAHRCNTTGFDPLPSKPAEQFTVHYIKDVNPITGEGTLVVPAYAPTYGGIRCDYESGTPVGIGLAELADAEFDTFGSFSRNNKSRNPYLPAGGTIITGARTCTEKATSASGSTDIVYTNHQGIPRGDNPIVDQYGDRGRGGAACQFMEIRVANIAPLITKNPRKNRHLRIYDRSSYGLPNASLLTDMNMKLRYDLPQPYGLKPWPVDHQTHSTAYSPWPRGGPHSPNPLLGGIPTESLRKDPALSLNQPGRVGPMPTMDNLNRMFRFTEEAMAGGMSTPIPEIWPFEPVQIDRFDNVYSDSDGTCINPYYETKKDCEKAKHFWVPQFLYTKVTTKYPHDLADAEKLVISGSVAYPATCKGARMGYCSGSQGDDINECNKGECIDTQIINSKWVHIDQDLTKGIINNKADCDASSDQRAMAIGAEDALPLVFKTKGQWIQIFDDPSGEDVIGNGDKHVCEEMFGGTWVVGKANNTIDDKGEYEDPLNLKPKEIRFKQEGFIEGCPVGCRLNGFYLQNPCEPPSEDFPQGQCFECVETIVVDSEGKETREMKCPLGPVDGNYVARKRGCQYAEYDNQKDCEENGWAWYGKITAANEFAIHQEMELTIHDASQLRSNLDAYKPTPAAGIATDWEFDLSNTPKRVTNDGGFTGSSVPLSSLGAVACNATRGAAWLKVGKCFDENDEEVDMTEEECRDITSNTWEEDSSGSRCIDLSRLDQEIPDSFAEGGEPTNQESSQAYELCAISDNCHFIQEYKTCLGTYWSDAGTCYRIEDGNVTEEAATKQRCDRIGGVFVGNPIGGINNADECAEYSLAGVCHVQGMIGSKTSKQECDELGGNWGVSRTGTAIYNFECVNPTIAGDYYTPEHCTEIGGGELVYKGAPQSISLDERKMNVVTMMDKLSNLSSPEAIAMGHDVGIGLSPRNHKGVIYSPQVDVSIKENKDYDKYADPNWRAVWSRHGGAFDIIVGYPPPENNCRQGNSDKPTSMDFYLNFDQICCNDKGPLNFHKCSDKCWHHYMGPHLNDMELVHGIPGNSILHVNIHE